MLSWPTGRGRTVQPKNMETNAQALKIGAVIFPGFELLDIYGPLEMLGLLRDRVSITMLAERPGEVRSNQGPKGVADAALADVSDLDVLLVPGGWGTRTEVQNEPFLDALRARAKEARFVASVCTGSALLAKAGVLDGKKATSNKLSFDWVTTQGPNVIWIREARWGGRRKYLYVVGGVGRHGHDARADPAAVRSKHESADCALGGVFLARGQDDRSFRFAGSQERKIVDGGSVCKRSHFANALHNSCHFFVPGAINLRRR